MHLIVQYFRSADPARQRELDACLKYNLLNPHIARVHILSEEPISFSSFDRNDKIEQSVIATRLTFGQAFRYANARFRPPGPVWIVCNADIFFDDSLCFLEGVSLDSTVFALTRHDVKADGGIEAVPLHYAHGCQDAWIFSPPVPVERMYTDFFLGVPGCDHRIAHEFVQAGYVVANPSLKIIARHLDLTRTVDAAARAAEYAGCCNADGYRSGKAVPPPYQYCLVPSSRLDFPDPDLYRNYLAVLSLLHDTQLQAGAREEELQNHREQVARLTATIDELQGKARQLKKEVGKGRAGVSVLLVLHSFLPAAGGVECYTAALAASLTELGCTVALFFPVFDTGAPLNTITRIRRNGFDAFTLASGDDTLLDSVSHAGKEQAFAEFLRTCDFDVIHFHHTHKHIPFSFIAVAKSLGKPVCLTLHDFWFICLRTHLYVEERGAVCSGPSTFEKCRDCFLDEVGHQVTPEQANALAAAIRYRHEYIRELLGKVDLISSPSRFLRDVFHRFGMGSGGIELSPLGVAQSIAQAPRRDDRLVFGFIGTLSRVKNMSTLTDAFMKTTGDASLLIFGKQAGESGAALLQAAEDPRIDYRGGYDVGDLNAIFALLDVVVVPSAIESYCLTVREALSAGIAVIAANVGGIPEAVTHGVNGLLFDTAEELSAILQRIIDNPGIIRGLRPLHVHVRRVDADACEWYERYISLKNRYSSGTSFVLGSNPSRSFGS